jgi:hypothetical protein
MPSNGPITGIENVRFVFLWLMSALSPARTDIDGEEWREPA